MYYINHVLVCLSVRVVRSFRFSYCILLLVSVTCAYVPGTQATDNRILPTVIKEPCSI